MDGGEKSGLTEVNEKSVAKDAGSGIIKASGIFRRTRNQKPFEHLGERMSKKNIRNIAKEFDIDLSGIFLTIEENEDLPKLPLAAGADTEKIGGITFFPNAFRNKEELLRTLFHEKQHISQFKEYGTEYVQEHRAEFEKITYEAEEKFINGLKKEGRL